MIRGLIAFGAGLLIALALVVVGETIAASGAHPSLVLAF